MGQEKTSLSLSTAEDQRLAFRHICDLDAVANSPGRCSKAVRRESAESGGYSVHCAFAALSRIASIVDAACFKTLSGIVAIGRVYRCT